MHQGSVDSTVARFQIFEVSVHWNRRNRFQGSVGRPCVVVEQGANVFNHHRTNLLLHLRLVNSFASLVAAAEKSTLIATHSLSANLRPRARGGWVRSVRADPRVATN